MEGMRGLQVHKRWVQHLLREPMRRPQRAILLSVRRLPVQRLANCATPQHPILDNLSNLPDCQPDLRESHRETDLLNHQLGLSRRVSHAGALPGWQFPGVCYC